MAMDSLKKLKDIPVTLDILQVSFNFAFVSLIDRILGLVGEFLPRMCRSVIKAPVGSYERFWNQLIKFPCLAFGALGKGYLNNARILLQAICIIFYS